MRTVFSAVVCALGQKVYFLRLHLEMEGLRELDGELCFNFDLWHSDHLLAQFIPQLVWRNLRDKDQSLIQFVTLTALAMFFQGSRRAKQTNLRKQGHHTVHSSNEGPVNRERCPT